MSKSKEECFFTMMERGEINAVVDQHGLAKMGPNGFFGRATSFNPDKTVPPIPPRNPRDRKYEG